MSSKKNYDEVSVVRVLTHHRSITIIGKLINIDNANNSIGNGTWGKIDYLVNNHKYRYSFVTNAGKKGYSRDRKNNEKENKQILEDYKSGKFTKTPVDMATMSNNAMGFKPSKRK